jgi:AcrR family transcriptional regulator
MAGVKAPSSLREEQAAQTRRRILRAAAEVFEELGFAGARIEDVAARAGVAVPTVYKAFANKANLLIGAVDQAMAGDDAVPLERQPWFAEQLEEPDPVRQLQLIARNARRIYERAGPLLGVLRAATPLDPSLARAWQDIAAQRVERSRATARTLQAKAGARLRRSRNETSMTLLVLTEPELFTTFMVSGRTADQYEGWLADVLVRSVLD